MIFYCDVLNLHTLQTLPFWTIWSHLKTQKNVLVFFWMQFVVVKVFYMLTIICRLLSTDAGEPGVFCNITNKLHRQSVFLGYFSCNFLKSWTTVGKNVVWGHSYHMGKLLLGLGIQKQQWPGPFSHYWPGKVLKLLHGFYTI